MKNFLSFLLCLFVIFASFTKGYAQHEHPSAETKTGKPQLGFSPVLSTFLSDPELKKYKMESTLLTVDPYAEDTVSHRHDAELFGYVIEGSVEVGLEHRSPVTFTAGQMFYEKRNILHSYLKNPDSHQSAKVLLISIIKDGRERYTRAYPEK